VGRSNLVASRLVVLLDSNLLVEVVVFVGDRFLELVLAVVVLAVVFLGLLVVFELVVLVAYFVVGCLALLILAFLVVLVVLVGRLRF